MAWDAWFLDLGSLARVRYAFALGRERSGYRTLVGAEGSTILLVRPFACVVLLIEACSLRRPHIWEMTASVVVDFVQVSICTTRTRAHYILLRSGEYTTLHAFGVYKSWQAFLHSGECMGGSSLGDGPAFLLVWP